MTAPGLHFSRIGALALITAGALSASPAIQAAENGLRVVKDPVTGQLRGPTAEEFKAMQEQEDRAKAAQRSVPAARTVPHRNAHGGLSHQPGERAMTFSVVRRDADGNLTMQCVTGANAAAQAVSEAQTSTPAKEHGHDQQ